jgi:hypothetical protein
MKILKIDGTTYTIKNDRDQIEFMALARKKFRKSRFKDIRKFPVYIGQTTAAYIRQFEHRNFLIPTPYDNLNDTGTAQYDASIPLIEVLTCE